MSAGDLEYLGGEGDGAPGLFAFGGPILNVLSACRFPGPPYAQGRDGLAEGADVAYLQGGEFRVAQAGAEFQRSSVVW
ncbi:hypothetical protein IMZ11_41385 [Microtetraspora sp. AC03309]|uniref:hypothetical protein n=1 Tax=Microtetraspora sp. AC03309 TaxID=2779376 RepID=UPI001E627ECF|nr:hypothetical protein [Microtetraspora sp. AC03309]MCC5582070.1 hypothetical protein [Microtetraspora sp. AC03309]